MTYIDFPDYFWKFSYDPGCQNYHNDPKLLDRQVQADSVDPDETAPEAWVLKEQPDQGLQTFPSAFSITVWKKHAVEILG